MEAIARCNCVKDLYVGYTKIGNDDLLRLMPATRLKSITVTKTRVTDKGYIPFHKARPDVIVTSL